MKAGVRELSLESLGLPLVTEWHDLSSTQRAEINNIRRPVVLRGCVSDWPLVRHAATSFEALAAYLLKFDKQRVFQAMIAHPQERGRLFYGPDMRSFNFKRMNGYLPDAMKIFADIEGQQNGPSFYIGSSLISEYLPGLEIENAIDGVTADPNIWMGTAVTVATHNDNYQNIACVAAGRRRFTLFPPEQEKNLYLGPKHMTPAGRAISLVDLAKPDLEQFPKFKDALQTAEVAVLEPGDAIYIPANWWHNVESLGDFNILVNYWWNGNPPPLNQIV